MNLPVIEFLGLQIAIEHDFNGELLAVISHFFESEEMAIYKNVLESNDRLLVAGVGSGWTALYCAYLVGSADQVFGYEPNTIWHPILKDSLRYQDKAIKIYPQALSANKNPEIIFWNNQIPYQSRIESPEQPIATNISPATVPAIYVNDAITKHNCNTLVLDVEGYEKELLPVIDFGLLDKLIIELHLENDETIENMALEILKANKMEIINHMKTRQNHVAHICAVKSQVIPSLKNKVAYQMMRDF